MKITGKQAQEIIGCSGASVINRLIKAGILHDLKEHDKNAKKIFPIFDSVEVNKVAKVWSSRATIDQMLANLQNGNFHKNIAPPKPIQQESNIPNGIITRLDRIEQMLDKLVKMWS